MGTSLSRHWRSAADALAVLRRQPGLTRAELGTLIALKSGPTSDLVKRLVAADLIVERPTPSARRGRPTMSVHAAPAGPVALVVDIRHGDWRLGQCALDGEVELLASGTHAGRPEELLDELHGRVSARAHHLGERLVGVGIAVPGPTAGPRLVHATMLGWRDVELSRVGPEPGVPLVVVNDATAAAIAEARLHGQQPRTLLHLVLEVGIGGALVVDGRPVPSASGLQGEFGHVPFGDPALRCPCGARGCWTIAFGVEAIAEALQAAPPTDPRSWLRQLFTATAPAPDARRLRDDLAADLGRGVAGFVNAMDPDLVTLGGLARELRSASLESFERSLSDGLMAVHREHPPAVVAARGGEDAPLIGLGLSVFDLVLDADLLARWGANRQVSA